MSQTIPGKPDMQPLLSPNSDTRQAAAPSRRPPVKQRKRGLLGALVGSIPTVLTFVVLGVLAFAGHHAGWKLPKFSELTAGPKASEPAWCNEHGVPEAECISCNAKLMPKGKLFGWCAEHGVHECVLHHPEVAQLSKSPKVSPADFQRAKHALALRKRPENNSACKLHLRRIQFTTVAAVEKAGIDIRLVDRGRIVESISANGEVIYDPTQVAQLSSRAEGTLWRVEKGVGDQVRRGELLALVDAVEVGRLKARLLQSLTTLQLCTRTYQRLAKLGNAVPGRRVLDAETAMSEAEIAVHQAVQSLINLGLPVHIERLKQRPVEQLVRDLKLLGLPATLAGQLDVDQITSNLLPIVAPMDGVIVSRSAVPGEQVQTSKLLFTVVDTSRMWLLLRVRQEEAPLMRLGQKVVFQADGSDHEDAGTLIWISTALDRKSRTVEVRAELPNPDGHLRDETYGAGQIVLREELDAIVVPSESVHWEGCCHVVFVRDKDFMKEGSYKVFHTRSVRPGVANAGSTELLAGVLPGEVIVTKGSGVLRAELLKGNLGAG